MHDDDRRDAVHNWRWTEDRSKAPTIKELHERWPEMEQCEHPELSLRTGRNREWALFHVDCLDCPKGAMRGVSRSELTDPGAEINKALTGSDE